MGKWRHRAPRRFYRQEKLPSPSPLPFHPQPPPSSGSWQDGIPYWEKQYCTLVGSIPWWKVVDAKNYVYGNNYVLNWDDSGGKEAFQNAKQRFWADINGLPCDISLPDPNIYIDEIDWNPFIDTELIKEVDREYFAPVEGEVEGKNGQGTNKTEYSASVPSDGDNRVQNNHTNPWECDNVQGRGDFKNKSQGRNQWGAKCSNELTDLVNDDNPWERGSTQVSETMQKNAWEESRDKSWGWNQMEEDISLSKGWDNGGNSWEHGCQGVSSVKGNRWGDPISKYWGRNQQESKNVDRTENPWGCSLSQNSKSLKDRGWRDRGGDEWGWKQSERHNNPKSDLDFRIQNNGRGARNEGGNKRERPHQYISGGYKDSRFRGSEYQTGNSWGRGNNRNRVSFAFE